MTWSVNLALSPPMFVHYRFVVHPGGIMNLVKKICIRKLILF
jgi:hypothetical protein